MFISRGRNFIFLHTPKTAGTSVSLSLARDMRPDDIMIGGWTDACRHRIPYNAFALGVALRSPLRCTTSTLKNVVRHGRFAPRCSFVNNQIKHHFRSRHGFVAEAHTPAEIVRRFDPELWARAFKFTFVRNPWSHAVSHYEWCCRKTLPTVGFREFLLRQQDPDRPDPEKVRPMTVSNWPIYTIDDVIAADFIGRFETIDEDLAALSARLGFEVSIGTIAAKTGVRNKAKPVAAYYDEECVEIVRRLYRQEIEAFSFEVPFGCVEMAGR
ncbi:sulfotransferase family 2 domain-containing protein [Rubrivivax gelatinosus]|uniref:Sulfotransferase family protein n=1 Tax=Rubrivivax gelatinosus TaxID=28068 RepID=A0A4R2MJE3_RUBGE|nr:sulfotransferase family 2 domain-containing protein [Rubrivivax gelatinosus]TCP03036.1 sulfotransferase family protein [Rubrivivax gelatinosus]